MTRILLSLFLFLLFQLNLRANTGNISTIDQNQELQTLPSFQSIQDKYQNRTIIWEIESTIAQINSRFFAQKVNQHGELIWGNNVELTSGGKRIQSSHKMVEDGLGGVIITWEERREGKEETDIYVQRIDPQGKKLWSEEGLLITTASGSQITPNVASDNKGGAVIAWSDSRNDPSFNNWDIYAQKISPSGKILWNEEGVIISTDTKDEFVGKVISTRDGGATIIWNAVIKDILDEGEGFDFFSKRLNAKGRTITSLNSASFISLPISETKYKLGGDIINDGHDGFLLTLVSNDSNAGNSLYLQHVLPTGEAVFQGELGRLVDNNIYALQSLSYKTDSLGNIQVGWSEKEEDKVFAYTQQIEPSYLAMSDTAVNTLAVLDDTEVLNADSTDTIASIALAPPDSAISDSVEENLVLSSLDVERVPKANMDRVSDSATLEKPLTQNVQDLIIAYQKPEHELSKSNFDSKKPVFSSLSNTIRGSLNGSTDSSPNLNKGSTPQRTSFVLKNKSEIVISIKPGPNLYPDKFATNQIALFSPLSPSR